MTYLTFLVFVTGTAAAFGLGWTFGHKKGITAHEAIVDGALAEYWSERTRKLVQDRVSEKALFASLSQLYKNVRSGSCGFALTPWTPRIGAESPLEVSDDETKAVQAL